MLIQIKKGAQFLAMPISVVFLNPIFHLAFLLAQGRHTQPGEAKTLENQKSRWKPMLPKALLTLTHCRGWGCLPNPCRNRAEVCRDSRYQDLPGCRAGLMPDSLGAVLAPPLWVRSQQLPSGGCSHSTEDPGCVFAPACIHRPRSTKAIRSAWVKSNCLDRQSHCLACFYVVTPEGSKTE